jgi:hypothetical protein
LTVVAVAGELGVLVLVPEDPPVLLVPQAPIARQAETSSTSSTGVKNRFMWETSSNLQSEILRLPGKEKLGNPPGQSGAAIMAPHHYACPIIPTWRRFHKKQLFGSEIEVNLVSLA